MLDRQLRQVPRWLGQSRYNGPSGGGNKPRLPAGDVAKHPTIAPTAAASPGTPIAPIVERGGAAGRDPRARRGPRATASPAPRGFPVSPPGTAASAKPRSAYNSVLSADGADRRVRDAPSRPIPLAKRVGQMSVVVRDLGTRSLDKVSHAGLPAGAPTRTAFNPSLSADGRVVAFEATDSGRNRPAVAQRPVGGRSRRAA